MKFWKQFSKQAVLRQLLFALLIFALIIPFALWDSNTQIKVSFGEESVTVKSDKYSLDIQYADIVSAELTVLAEAGEKVADGVDNEILRCGLWKNDAWGEYYINADLDATDCILIHTKDGKTFVFNGASNRKTADLFETLQAHLPSNS